jgi:hypothetical protein
MGQPRNMTPLRSQTLTIAIFAVAAAVYFASYVTFSDRESSRARGAGEYFHYRNFNFAWEVYFFAPAAFVEAQMIQVCPKAFLKNPTWASTPQRLVIRVSDNSTIFWFPPFKPEDKENG